MTKCVSTVRVTSVSATTTTTTLTVSGFTGTLGRCGLFNLCIPQCIPNQYAGSIVSITDGTTTWPVLDRSGNNLRVAQLLCRCCKCGKLLHCRLANDPAHIQVCDKLPLDCNSALPYPTVTTAAAASVQSVTSSGFKV